MLTAQLQNWKHFYASGLLSQAFILGVEGMNEAAPTSFEKIIAGWE